MNFSAVNISAGLEIVESKKEIHREKIACDFPTLCNSVLLFLQKAAN